MKDDSGRLQDILEAIEKIETHLAGRREEFLANELLQVWAVHHLQIVGEGASRLSEDLRRTHPEVPWPKLVGMRNVLIHDYLAIDLDIVWVAVERDLPVLKGQIQAILVQFAGSS